MEASEYKELASRTLADPFYTNSQERRYGLHAAIGVCTEVGELVECLKLSLPVDCVNLQEEVGDCFWYLSIYERLFDFELEADSGYQKDIGFNSVEDILFKMTATSGQLLDIYKKAVFYDREELIGMIKAHSNEIFQMLVMLLDVAGRDVGSTREININKLKKRFPEKFTEEAAINRNVKAEREVLEGRDANV